MSAPPKKRNRLLVVEDNADAAEFLAIRLRSHQFKVHVESLGSKAIEHAKRYPPDLVILDLKLPDISGHKVCQQLQAMNPPSGIPVLMLTGLNHPIDELRGLAHGAGACLTKPYDPKELIKTVNCLLGEVPSSEEAA